MADIVIRNGYNGFVHKGHNSSFSKPLPSFKNRLPPLPNDKYGVVSPERGLQSPFLQGSLSDHSNTDIVILLDDEIKRIRQLSNNLGINHRHEIAQYHNRFHGLKQGGRLPQLESTKCWRQSHNWIKRMDIIGRGDTPKIQTGFDFKAAGKFTLDLDNLPKGRKKVLKPVDIPSLGCSYRLPIPKKQKQKTKMTIT